MTRNSRCGEEGAVDHDAARRWRGLGHLTARLRLAEADRQGAPVDLKGSLDAVDALVRLSAAMGRIVVYELRPSAVRAIERLPLRELPSPPPQLLASPWIVEVGAPERGDRLFGDTVSLAGYEEDGRMVVIGMEMPERIRLTRWEHAAWTYADSLLRTAAAADWRHAGAIFVTTLGVLLEQPRGPLGVREEAMDRAAGEGLAWTKRIVAAV
jgi:hypothetical protein